MIRYWCFDEAMLTRALRDWMDVQHRPGDAASGRAEIERLCQAFTQFLLSPQARTHKLLVEIDHDARPG